MLAWAHAFALTELVEVPIYLAALRRHPWLRRLGGAFGASLLTHPLLWFALPALPLSYPTYVFVAEVATVLVEAGFLKLLGSTRPLVWAIAANGASFLLGKLFF